MNAILSLVLLLFTDVPGGVPPVAPASARPHDITAEHLQALVADAQRRAATSTNPACANLGLPPPHITLAPGASAMLAIGRQHLNRLLTPFPSPVLRTTSELTIQIDGQVIYLATASAEPFVAYLHDASRPEDAVILTLVPCAIPGVSVRIETETTVPVVPTNTSLPGWQEHPYLERIAAILRTVAQGRVPDGFSLRPLTDRARLQACELPPGVTARPHQILRSTDYTLYVIGIQRTSGDPIALDERACTTSLNVAAAYYPKRILGAGESAELYLLDRHPPPHNGHLPTRPRAIPSLANDP